MRKMEETLCHKWMQEVWNQGRRESIRELLCEDVVANGLLPDGPMIGIEAFEQYFDNFKKDFSNIYITVDDVIAQDDMESVICTVKATHIPTQKEVNFTGQCMIRVRDGKLAEAWNHFDFYSMYRQLGYELAPAMVEAPEVSAEECG